MPRKPEEGYWKAAAILTNAVRAKQCSSLLVSAPSRREGTTTVTLQVAHALSTRCDVRPLVMELDFWKPVLVKKLKLDPYKTLASVLAGDLRLPDAVQQLESGVAVLAACEKRSPPVRSLTTLVADTVALAVDKWDIVLVDTPPLTEYGALLNVGTVIPRLLMVVRAGFSSTATIDRFQQDLHNVGIEAFGTILNREKRYVPAWIEKPARVNDIETPSQRVY